MYTYYLAISERACVLHQLSRELPIKEAVVLSVSKKNKRLSQWLIVSCVFYSVCVCVYYSNIYSFYVHWNSTDLLEFSCTLHGESSFHPPTHSTYNHFSRQNTAKVRNITQPMPFFIQMKANHSDKGIFNSIWKQNQAGQCLFPPNERRQCSEWARAKLVRQGEQDTSCKCLFLSKQQQTHSGNDFTCSIKHDSNITAAMHIQTKAESLGKCFLSLE